MNDKIQKSGFMRCVGCGALLLASLSATGCQVSVNGQTLPSPHYLEDDIQFFAAGHEFKLHNEAAAIKAAKDESE